MKIVFAGTMDEADAARWREALSQACPGVDWITDFGPGTHADAAVVANPAPGALTGLRGLRLIQSLWAGVERLLDDPTLPPGVPLARMVDPQMSAAMAQTALWATLSLHRGFFEYAAQQRRSVWQQHRQKRAEEIRVLVLGLGAIGAVVAARLATQGYTVTGWRVTPGGRPAPDGVTVVAGDAALRQVLPQAQVVINLLPLTPTTRGLLDAAFFAAMAPGAGLVNLARGAHVVEADLLAALDHGSLRHAVLDVFNTEPLPAAHAFWQHPHVTLLPHTAALTDHRSAAQVVAANLQRLQSGEALQHLVDRGRGY
jgi:glyoxylate/hydroxypyruvate reductase A